MRLRLMGIAKRYTTRRGPVDALGGIDMEVARGEFFVLLGPSGCGKSTLLNLVAGLEAPSAGEIWFGDQLAASAKRRLCLSPKQRRVAMVFQSYALYPHLSVYGNIAFPLNMARRPKPEVDEAVRRVARTLQLEDLLQARPGELSGGQRQRVAIARSLVREPEVLLLDEPLSNLDAQLRTSTRAELKRLQGELGLTTLYVTHDQGEAMSLGDRIAVLRRGRVEQIASPLELYRQPENPFVAGFIGVPPMNLLEGVWEEKERKLALWVGPFPIPLPEMKGKALLGTPPRRCLVGIRPEHLRLTPGEEFPLLRGTIQTVEPQGKEVLLHVACAWGRVTVLAPEGEYALGFQVGLDFDSDRMLLFPKEAASDGGGDD